MLIFIATFLPMNFYTRTLFILWMPLPLYYLLLCRSSHHCWQHHSPLLILLCLIIAPISAVTRVVPVVTGVPITTATTTSHGVPLLPTGDSFPVRVMMVFMSSPSLLPHQFLKLLVSLHLLDCRPVVSSFRSSNPSHFRSVSFQQ
jgi:hypothetical protein